MLVNVWQKPLGAGQSRKPKPTFAVSEHLIFYSTSTMVLKKGKKGNTTLGIKGKKFSHQKGKKGNETLGIKGKKFSPQKGKKGNETLGIKGKKFSHQKGKKGKKTSLTSNRPVLNTSKLQENADLSENKKLFKQKIVNEGLDKKRKIPAGNIALEKNKTLKNKVKPTERSEISGNPGIVCLTNIPHGFFEKQLKCYFTQFGEVNHVKVVRSKLTGRSCGYAYVEFKDAVVANVAVETMNNYLTYGKIIKCRFIGYTPETSKKLFGEQFRPKNCPKVKSRTQAIKCLNALRTEKQVESRAKRVKRNFDKKLKLLQSLGINMDLQLDCSSISKIADEKNEIESSGEGSNNKLEVKVNATVTSTTEETSENPNNILSPPKNGLKTPKVNKDKKKLAVSEKKGSLKKRKASQGEGSIEKKPKRLSL